MRRNQSKDMVFRASMNQELLFRILTQPSAPFREEHVYRAVSEHLRQQKVPHFFDRAGNLVIGAAHLAEYKRILAKRSKEPLRVFIAHTDHPGFHGAEWTSDTELKITWHGGSPTHHLEGARVWLADDTGVVTEGTLVTPHMAKHGKAIETALIALPTANLRHKHPRATELYGGFAFRSAYWVDGETVYTKAADDLVGSFAIVDTACRLWEEKSPDRANFIGLLTRGEEVGFIGCLAHLEEGHLQRAKRDVICVSLETSRMLPGAESGRGPVVRLGDKSTVFDSGALRTFIGIAMKALPEAHQKRVMDGGTCEGTAATAYGLKTIAISIPLGNYHNQSFEGGPDSRGANGPAPEFVHLKDVAGMLTLCREIVRSGHAWGEPWAAYKKTLQGYLKDYDKLMRAGLPYIVPEPKKKSVAKKPAKKKKRR